jgi:CorA-like Mg2+ transporter protein
MSRLPVFDEPGGAVRRQVDPLLDMLAALEAGFTKYGIDEELRRYLRDVTDHATTVVERVDDFRQLLTNILTVNATLVAQAQNEEMRHLTEDNYDQNEEIKRVSAWAAILFAPTLIGSVYGMNFDYMPERHWLLGYPLALGLMLLTCLGAGSTKKPMTPGGVTRRCVKLCAVSLAVVGCAWCRLVPETKNDAGARPWYPRLLPPSTCLSVMSL